MTDKTKFILLSQRSDMKYPVGERISENMELIKEMVDKFKGLKLHVGKHVNIICRGSSGAIIAAFFAMKLPKCSIAHIKKEGESSHNSSFYLVEDDAVNIIVDDLISSGSTMNTIYEKVKFKYSKIKIDAVCISGYSNHRSLNFESTYFICGAE